MTIYIYSKLDYYITTTGNGNEYGISGGGGGGGRGGSDLLMRIRKWWHILTWVLCNSLVYYY